jgi:hypothetical protein
VVASAAALLVVFVVAAPRPAFLPLRRNLALGRLELVGQVDCPSVRWIAPTPARPDPEERAQAAAKIRCTPERRNGQAETLSPEDCETTTGAATAKATLAWA